MICKKCKKEIPDASAFCNLCGAKQERAKSRRSRGNGTGSVYQMSNGKWRAILPVPMGRNAYVAKRDGGPESPKRKSKSGFATKKEAQAWIHTMQGGAAPSEITLEYLHEKWKATDKYDRMGSKKVAYKIAYNNLEPLWHRRIGTLRLEDLQACVDAIEGYYPRKDARQLLSNLLKIAEINGDISKNMAQFIALPSHETEEIQPFNEDEINLFWKDYQTGNVFTGYILLMIFAGMGPGELLKARKHMIDWAQQTIDGAGVKTRDKKDLPIVIADVLIPVLRELCKVSIDSPKLLPMGEKAFRDQFEKTIARLGVRDLKPYSCRHTTSTALTLAGVDTATIMKIMRHRRYQTTLGYTHINLEPMLQGVNLISDNYVTKR